MTMSAIAWVRLCFLVFRIRSCSSSMAPTALIWNRSKLQVLLCHGRKRFCRVRHIDADQSEIAGCFSIACTDKREYRSNKRMLFLSKKQVSARRIPVLKTSVLTRSPSFAPLVLCSDSLLPKYLAQQSYSLTSLRYSSFSSAASFCSALFSMRET